MILHPAYYSLIVDRTYISLFLGGLVLEWICVACLIQRRVHHKLPIFTVYLLAVATGDTFGALEVFGTIYLATFVFTVVHAAEYVLEFGMILELLVKIIDSAIPGLNLPRISKIAILYSLTCVAASAVAMGSVTYLGVRGPMAMFFTLAIIQRVTSCLMCLGVIGVIVVIKAPWKVMASQFSLCLAFYFVIALLARGLHALNALKPAHYVHFEEIDCIHMAAWCVAIALISVHVLRSPSVANNNSAACSGQVGGIDRHPEDARELRRT